ncbi:MAG TPA: hypothetical protein VN081_05285 [Dongiaceae bacterium]|nr:hypothetical protein [Dongiaceae bacterium]
MHKVEEVVQAFPDDLKQIHTRARELAAVHGFDVADPVFYLLALVETAAGPETPRFGPDGKEPSELRNKNGAAITWLRSIGVTKYPIAHTIDEYFHHVDHPSTVHAAAAQAYRHMMYELGERCRSVNSAGPALYRYDLLEAIALSESVLVEKVFTSLHLSGDYFREALRLEPLLPSHIDPRLAAV